VGGSSSAKPDTIGQDVDSMDYFAGLDMSMDEDRVVIDSTSPSFARLFTSTGAFSSAGAANLGEKGG
jgi:hypothetical protein